MSSTGYCPWQRWVFLQHISLHTKWVSGELLCSCGKGRDCCSGPHQCYTVCSRIPSKQTNKCALVQITQTYSMMHHWRKKNHSIKSGPQWKNSPGVVSHEYHRGRCNLMWPFSCCDCVGTAAQQLCLHFLVATRYKALQWWCIISQHSSLICMKVIVMWCSNLGGYHT